MLKSALIAMTVMGCDCDARLCVPLDGPAQRFASIEACEAALTDELRARRTAAYPLIEARCAVDPAADAVMVADSGVADVPADHALSRAGAAVVSRYAALLDAGVSVAGERSRSLLSSAGGGMVAARAAMGEALGAVSGVASSASGWVLGSVSR